jgi:hypothetical protein
LNFASDSGAPQYVLLQENCCQEPYRVEHQPNNLPSQHPVTNSATALRVCFSKTKANRIRTFKFKQL